MRNLGCVVGLSLMGMIGCQQQQPAAAPLAPPAPPPTEPAATPAPVASTTAELKKEEAKPPALTAEQKIKLYQDCWAAFNSKDFAKFSECWADDATSEQVDARPPLMGKSDLVEKGVKPFAVAFPDIAGEHELVLVNGNYIAGIALLRGTQKGPLATPGGELPPTNKKVGYLMGHVIELNDKGKAQKEWIYTDLGTLLGQLGKFPGPHRKVLESGWAEKPIVTASGSELEKSNLAAYNKSTEAFNKHDVPAIVAGLTDDVVLSDQAAPADRVGKKEVQKGVEEIFKAMSDVKVEPKNVWAAGDYVVATGSFEGTNDGDMPSMHLKKTGKKVNMQFLEIDKLEGGKIKNMWLFSNGMAMAGQLGLLPQPKPGKAGEHEHEHMGADKKGPEHMGDKKADHEHMGGHEHMAGDKKAGPEHKGKPEGTKPAAKPPAPK